MKTNITQPLKYHGGKAYLAGLIHELASKIKYTHRVIPFFGGGAEFWNMEYEGISEVINDIDGRLMNFYRVLQDDILFERFMCKIYVTPFSETLWHEANNYNGYYQLKIKSLMNESLIGKPNNDNEEICNLRVTAAFYFFILVRQSMAGRMRSFSPLSKTRTRRGMNEQAASWLSAIEGLPAVHERLRRVVILNNDGISVIKKEDSETTLFILDPPYLSSTRTAKQVYEFEMSETQHKELLDTLSKIRGKFILCGYDNDLYDEYKTKFNWNKVEKELPNNAASGDTKRRMIECLWSNF
jgi:DNA adenine methylase